MKLARALFVPLALSLLVGLASQSLATELAPPATRIAKIRVTTTKGARKETIAAPQIAFQPGQRSEMKVADIKSGDHTRSVEVVLSSQVDKDPTQHQVEVKVLDQIGQGQPMVVSSPKVLTVDGKPASVSINEANGDSLEIELVVELAK